MRNYVAIAICAFLIMTVGASNAADMQYHRDDNGALVMQVNPGANTTGPYRNLPTISGTDFLYAENVGTPRHVAGTRKSHGEILYDDVDVTTVFDWHRREVTATYARRSTQPYMKICRHLPDGVTVCEEFDMGVVK